MAVDRITDDILVEILSRVPAKSLCRFKCVSKHWLGLTNDPHHRKRLPQTLAGFFYSGSSRKTEQRFLESPVVFTNLGGTQCCRPPIDTSFAFLPSHRRLDLLDSCNGLLLFRWYDVSGKYGDFRYIVCNPATEEWAALPDSGQEDKLTRLTMERTAWLGFDPAVSPHFHVFEFVEELDPRAHFLSIFSVHDTETGVSVYSSETGGWVHKEKRSDQLIRHTKRRSASVFGNGNLHFHAFDREYTCRLAAVDTEAETWMNFGVPGGVLCGLIQWSQGRLHYANFQGGEDGAAFRLVVYVLEDYGSKEWKFKHSVEMAYIFKGMSSFSYEDFDWIAIHPDCNLIFFAVGWRYSTFRSYDMDSRQVKVICDLEDGRPPYLPYVPLYAELPSLHVRDASEIPHMSGL
ncbi:F-box protein At5g07610 isoform X2 [Brachypodium distachyon]|nr:F-box protein At5g07610 isoform X2 [Brachypodium distachyon]|eukprot:XP_014753020.1 F-box protein At5g07610 isoform X2 [Brachypodium distachyon]